MPDFRSNAPTGVIWATACALSRALFGSDDVNIILEIEWIVNPKEDCAA